VSLLVFGDFQCPYSRRVQPVLGALAESSGGRVRFLFRHFPLTNVHEHAQRAAEAAEWAAAEGAFWPMHDALFQVQDLGDRSILELAERLRLVPRALERAWTAHTFIPHIKEDFQSGILSGVSGTPRFFIDEIRYDGPTELEAMRLAVEECLSRPERP
jgi:protein-disulfide isomerase